jgi:hypothetical protein
MKYFSYTHTYRNIHKKQLFYKNVILKVLIPKEYIMIAIKIYNKNKIYKTNNNNNKQQLPKKFNFNNVQMKNKLIKNQKNIHL